MSQNDSESQTAAIKGALLMDFDNSKEIDRLREKCLNKTVQNHELKRLTSKLNILEKDFLTTPKANGKIENRKLAKSYTLLLDRMSKNTNLSEKLEQKIENLMKNYFAVHQ
jgi:hypothetical protein